MNNNFEYVINSTLNNSKTKEAHLFPKAPRLLPTKQPNCATSAYDLHRSTMTHQINSKTLVFPKQERFRIREKTSPSPDAYHRKSFLDINIETMKGNSFAREGLQQKIKMRVKNTPGPGSYYDRYNPQINLAYTMRSKINLPPKFNKVGPGSYVVQKYEAVKGQKNITSKYANLKQIKFGQDARFKRKQSQIPGPGAYHNNKVKTEMGEHSYRFSASKRQVVLTLRQIGKRDTPGPGSYNKFSQFSELKGGLKASRKMTQH